MRSRGAGPSHTGREASTFLTPPNNGDQVKWLLWVYYIAPCYVIIVLDVRVATRSF